MSNNPDLGAHLHHHVSNSSQPGQFLASGRRSFLGQVLAAAALPMLPSQPRVPPVSLRAVPNRVIWGADARPREKVDSCFFNIVVPGRTLNLTGASVRLSSGGRLAKTTRLSAASLLAIKRETDGAEDTQLLSFWLREPRALALDRCEVTIEADAVALNLALDLERYEQKTPLIVPFRGPGVIDQAWMSDNGHTNSTEQFAVDLLALSDRFARGELNPRDNRDYAGWGRDIVAPGAGVVAIIQDGVPEQPRVDEIDERSFILTDGRSVGYGNHVVIDHENGEFSMLAHMQANSIPVRVGDRVEQGNIIGRLGSSGMSTEPHLHYQLQDGATSPAHSLPFRFSNLHRPLRRGLFFVTAAGDKP